MSAGAGSTQGDFTHRGIYYAAGASVAEAAVESEEVVAAIAAMGSLMAVDILPVSSE